MRDDGTTDGGGAGGPAADEGGAHVTHDRVAGDGTPGDGLPGGSATHDRTAGAGAAGDRGAAGRGTADRAAADRGTADRGTADRAAGERRAVRAAGERGAGRAGAGVAAGARAVDAAGLTEIRAREPERIGRAWRKRARRPLCGDDGRLLLVAADHPARAALGVRGDGRAMASRTDLLDRLATALSRPGVDGVLGTPDLLEDLLLMGALEDKVAIGSMNRGGLHGAVFELDDRFTACTPRSIAAQGLDGGKALTRICLDDPGTAATLEATAAAVTDLAELGLMALVEPFLSVREGGRVRNLLDPDSVITSIAVAAGLGASSAHTWLKLPVVDQLDRVLDATTLPTLLLGGDPQGDPHDTYEGWRAAMGLPAVRGLVVGRALLYPPDGDVAAAVDIAAGLVHPAARPAGRPSPGSAR